MEKSPTTDTKKLQPTRKPNGEKKVQELIKIKKQKIQEALAILKKQFPLAFKENPEPLKIGVLEELVEKLNGKISKNKIKGVLKYYTRNLTYHQAVLINTHRIDLAGKRCEPITAQQKEYSQKCLGEILAKAQQRHKQ